MRKFTVTVNGQDYDVVVKDSGAAAAPVAAAPAAAPAPAAAQPRPGSDRRTVPAGQRRPDTAARRPAP